MLKINIEQIGGESNVEIETKKSPLDDTLHLALESPKGIELEFETEKQAKAMRFRFYRRIKEHRRLLIRSFDQLVFTIEQASPSTYSLVVQRYIEPIIKVRT